MGNKSVCFSGHRPQKLPRNNAEKNVLKSRLYKTIIDCVNNGYSEFYTGCALGVDMWASQMVIELKRDHPDIKLHCVIPYKDHSKNWSGVDKFNFNCILDNADSVCCLSERYYAGCFAVRNRYIVDHSSLLIAVFKDIKSGTGQTVRYAAKNNIKTIELCYTDDNVFGVNEHN